MTLRTPAYGIEYLAEGEPATFTRAVLERNAKSIEAALLLGGVTPPGASTIAELVARVNALEGPVRAQLIQTTVQTGLAVGWQTISLAVGAADSHNGRQTDGTWIVPSGQGGLYEVDGAAAINVPAPALAGSRLLRNGAVYPGCLGGFGQQAGGALVAPLGTRFLRLSAGDRLTLQGYSGTGPWSTQSNADTASWVSLRRIAP